MPWNSTNPDGSKSVKFNRAKLQENTTYIQTTIGNSVVGTNTVDTRDHFWNVGSDEDGRHRFIQSPAFTVGGIAADPVIGTGMSAVQYVKTTNGRVEGFHRNAQGIYQHIPSFLSGTHVVTGSFTTILAVPTNVYGEIFMYTTAAGNESGQAGFFKSSGGTCEAWSYGLRQQGSSSAKFALRFGNGTDANGLNLRVVVEEASSGLTWNYRITYRAV